MKDYGSASLLLADDFDEESRWIRVERAIQTVKLVIGLLLALFFVVLLINALSLYFIARASQNMAQLDSYQDFLKRYPEKAVKTIKDVDRSEIYRERMEHIKEWNDAGNALFEANKFADWSEEELKKIFLPLEFDQNAFNNPIFNRTHPSFFTATAPVGFDWRQRNVISPVKDQGQCGSCWAFATTGLVEAANAIKSKTSPVSLSDQELVDCDTVDLGCNGGNVGYAVQYVYKNGLMTEQSYPYTSSKGDCRKSGFVSKVRNAYMLKRDESALTNWLANYGPFTVSINVTDSLMYYKSGVFQPTEDDCRNKPTGRHALLVVGYGSTNGVKYWIVKNSWGSWWGTEGGYLYFVRGRNACGIEEYPIGALA